MDDATQRMLEEFRKTANMKFDSRAYLREPNTAEWVRVTGKLLMIPVTILLALGFISRGMIRIGRRVR